MVFDLFSSLEKRKMKVGRFDALSLLEGEMRFGRYIFLFFGYDKNGKLLAFTRGTKLYAKAWWRVFIET